MLNIRYADKDDVEVLAQLGAKTFYDTFRPYNTEEDMQSYIAKAYNANIISEKLNDENIIYLIAENNDVPKGYVKLIQHSTNEKLTGKSIELEKIYVLKDEIGTGLGSALMKEAIRISKERGFDVLFLGVWQDNTHAITFYKHFGFDVFTTRSFQLGQQVCDDYLMKLGFKS